MTLSGYIPDLIEEDFAALVERALESHSRNSKTHSRNVEGYSRNAGPDPGNSGPDESNNPHADPVTHWCVHPGGRKILDSIAKAMRFEPSVLTPSYEVLSEYGNMSSPTILFVLRKILHELDFGQPNTVFGAAFGPGLTMETFIAKT
jgi:predicted naringenin-chalcone synthase